MIESREGRTSLGSATEFRFQVVVTRFVGQDREQLEQLPFIPAGFAVRLEQVVGEPFRETPDLEPRLAGCDMRTYLKCVGAGSDRK